MTLFVFESESSQLDNAFLMSDCLTDSGEELQELLAEKEQLKARIIELEQRVAWFERQYFGQKSEKRVRESDPRQLSLGELTEEVVVPPEPKVTVKEYQRGKSPKKEQKGTPEDSGLRFDESRVSVQEIVLPTPEVEGLGEDDYEVIGEDVSYKLAQVSSPYVVLKLIRKKFKIKGSGEIKRSELVPSVTVLEKSFADVSFLVCLLLDKFLYHQPLYRQHQRLTRGGIELSRGTLSSYASKTIGLLEAIYWSQLSSVQLSQTLAMDETPIKAGRRSKGKMHQGYIWPLYGDQDEIAFVFSPSRSLKMVREVLGGFCGVLITDGLNVYERFAKRSTEVVHALCWAYARRYFIQSQEVEPELSGKALGYIGELYIPAANENARFLASVRRVFIVPPGDTIGE